MPELEKIYSDWADKLPKCIGSERGCDADLVGEGHESNCPRHGLEDVTFFDAFRAGAIEGLRLAEEIAANSTGARPREIAEAIRAKREKVENT